MAGLVLPCGRFSMPVTRTCTSHRMRRASICQPSQRAAFQYICSPFAQSDEVTIQMPHGTTVINIHKACRTDRTKLMAASIAVSGGCLGGGGAREQPVGKGRQ